MNALTIYLIGVTDISDKALVDLHNVSIGFLTLCS